MIIKQAYWVVGKELKWNEYGKRAVTRYNKKMTEIELEIKTDFDVEGWTVEGHYSPPSHKISRKFIRLSSVVADNKVTFALEDTVTSEIGEWLVEFVLKGENGEVYGSKDKLKYTVEETANAKSYDEILNEEDNSSVDAAMAGLKSEMTAAETKKTELEETTVIAEVKKQEVITVTSEADSKKAELEVATSTAETTKSELETENTAGQGTLQEIKDEGDAQNIRIITEGNKQEARLIAEGDIQEARIKDPVTGLETRVNNVEEIVTSDTIRVGLYDPNSGLPNIIGNYGNQYWEASASGQLDIPGLGVTEVEEYSKLYYMDNSRWEYISARSDLLPKGNVTEKYDTAEKIGNEMDKQASQLQNLDDTTVKVLDDSLVAVISPKGISSNVLSTNAINTGYNVIDGEDVSFVKDEDGFYVGEGYENIADFFSNVSPSTWTGDVFESQLTIPVATHPFSNKGGLNSTEVNEIGDNISISFEYEYIKKGQADLVLVATGNIYENSTPIPLTAEEGQRVKVHENLGTVIASSTEIIRTTYTTNVTDEVIIKFYNFTATKTPNKVPFIPHSFKGGELKINSFNPESETLLIIGKSGHANDTGHAHRILFQNGIQNPYIWYGAPEPNQNFVAYINSDIRKATYEILEVGGGFQGNPLDVNFPLSFQYHPNSLGSSHIYSIFKFSKKMTEGEINKQIEIIKSGNYTLPPHTQGTLLPIEGMVRCGDNYGIVSQHIEVTDISRDLWYVDGIAMYEVIDNDLATHYVRVNDDNSITGAALEDISGRLRVAATITLPVQVRKVK